MTESVSNSIQWIDPSITIDRSFLDEVPLIPEKALQGIMDPIMGSAVDKLFDCDFPGPWALFVPFEGYRNSIRRLFRNKVLATFDPELASETLDNFFEAEGDARVEEGDKIYGMLEELTNLNSILEEIYLKLLSCLKL